MPRLRRHPDVAWQTIGEEAVLMNLAGGRALGLNATGALVWARLDEAEEDELARAVAERFAIAPEAAREDVRAFLADLVARGLALEA